MANYSGDGANFAASNTVIGPNSIITTVAGNGYRATAAIMVRPPPPNCAPRGRRGGLRRGHLHRRYYNDRIREVNHATGVITTVAGNGTAGYSGDNGPATAAELDGPDGVAVDSAGDLFIADSMNQRIREVNHATGVITTVAGNGTRATAAMAARPPPPNWTTLRRRGGSAGDIFIADTCNNGIREVNHATGADHHRRRQWHRGYSGDGGPATAAELSYPQGVALDAAGDLFIADSGNNRIREVNHATGVITTVAGNGTQATAAITVRPPPPSCTTPLAWRWTPPGTSSSPTRQQPDPRGESCHRRDHHRRRQWHHGLQRR